jgi:hypothetical protein
MATTVTIYLTDADGALLLDADGAYLVFVVAATAGGGARASGGKPAGGTR